MLKSLVCSRKLKQTFQTNEKLGILFKSFLKVFLAAKVQNVLVYLKQLA